MCVDEVFLRFCLSPKPISPSVSPLMRAAPDATSRICSTLWTRVPSRMAWYSQVFLLYRFRMWQSVESAVSSTAADGILHTAIPVDMHKRSVWFTEVMEHEKIHIYTSEHSINKARPQVHSCWQTSLIVSSVHLWIWPVSSSSLHYKEKWRSFSIQNTFFFNSNHINCLSQRNNYPSSTFFCLWQTSHCCLAQTFKHPTFPHYMQSTLFFWTKIEPIFSAEQYLMSVVCSLWRQISHYINTKKM